MRRRLVCLLFGLLVLDGCAKFSEHKLDATSARGIHKILLLEPPAQAGGFIDGSLDSTVSQALRARGFNTRTAFTEAMAEALRADGYQVEIQHIMHLAPHLLDSYAGIKTDADAVFDVVEIVMYRDGWSYGYTPTMSFQARLATLPDGRPVYELAHGPQMRANAVSPLPLQVTKDMRLTEAQLRGDPAAVEAAIRATLQAGARHLAVAVRPAP